MVAELRTIVPGSESKFTELCMKFFMALITVSASGSANNRLTCSEESATGSYCAAVSGSSGKELLVKRRLAQTLLR